ncbi:MAG: viroplasmin family protein [Lachnospiraceae bacterium]|jgi:viroplasmin and RNaseH domain-containing protein
MKKKYYAVKKGLIPGIYDNWEACRVQVEGYSGAAYKGFATLDEARKYLESENEDIRGGEIASNGAGAACEADKVCEIEPGIESEDIPCPPENCAIAYVDGSFKESAGKFSYGVVMFINRDGFLSEKRISKSFSDAELLEMRNVSGEIMGCAEAMKQARELELKEITVYHDYEGIAKWCLGEWKANKPWIKKYKAFYDDISKELVVHFVKVKGHSGDKYNDLADELAKAALE